MSYRIAKPRVGPRTLKTALAVIVAMLIVESYGATTSKLIFAMLGAMAAVEPTFNESVASCLTQIVGVLFGALVGVLLRLLPLHQLVATGIGIILVIVLYNCLRIRFSPSLPCFIVVTMCTSPEIQPWAYAVGRIWDTAIGLSVGMVINTLVMPYDNSRQIRATVRLLEREVIAFLEEMFDGDEELPQAREMEKTIDEMERQLQIFSNQRLFWGRKRQKEQLERFRKCDGKARELVARMEILSQVGGSGGLSPENRAALEEQGAVISEPRPMDPANERDVVIDYHVRQILKLRRELLEALGE